MYNKLWFKNYKIARIYFNTHHTLSMPRDFKTIDGISKSEEGINLGFWLARQRQLYKNGNLDIQKIKLLEKIGIKWKRTDYWNEKYLIAKQYYLENKNLLVPAKYEINGFALGLWVISQRQLYKNKKLSNDKIKKLKKIGMKWDYNKMV